MGLGMQGGGRRSKVGGCSAVAVPRYGPASPFKGHLSTKSNAFCIDSSRNLTNQYLIRDHMLFHYNRILSAKAAVDCSAPKSRSTSVKFSDQQRREKLKKKIAKCGEKMCVCEATSQSCSRDCGRLLPCSFRKSLLEAADRLCLCPGQAQCLPTAASPYGEHYLFHSCPVKCTRKCSRNISKVSHSKSCICLSKPPNKPSGLSRSRSTESFVNVSYSQRYQGNNPRASGDLLERHSECFTKSQKPFTPRTLISNAKSSLAEYRYYTPARRKKKNHHKQCVEAQTQTDTISFPSADKVCVRKVMDEQKITSKAEDKINTSDEPEGGIDGFQDSILRNTSRSPQESSLKRTVDSEEEELLYLTLIEDVTNEILRLGLFSNRVLDEIFECYIEENKNRLDEGKMRRVLDALKSDLGCGQDSETELIHAGQEALAPLQECDTLEELKCASEGHRLTKAKSKEFLETTDSSLKEPHKCESLSWSERSRQTQSKEDFSEDTAAIMDAGTECDFCGVEFEEHAGTSSTCEACDTGLEGNKELDKLEENLAEALHISHNYSLE